MFLEQKDVWKKLRSVEESLQAVVSGKTDSEVPSLPGRDIQVQSIHKLPGRMALSTVQGQQKLLHDLANIELQAMELGFRTLIEFPEAPEPFQLELAQIVLEEAKHLKMCLESLETIGGSWGQWPVHLGLWHSTDRSDSLLERLFIVHRYLEGSGLDAGEAILRRLSGVKTPVVKQTVQLIVDEEVGHVAFGSRWYRYFCENEKTDEDQFFLQMCRKLQSKHPRRDQISSKLRREAEFSEYEISVLKELRKK